MSDVPDFVGDDQGESSPVAEEGDERSGPSLVPGAPGIQFDPEYVQWCLEESFSWLADKFDSAHWLLTDRQSKMLTQPTTQLMSSLFTKVQELLPIWLARWADSTPGLLDCVFAFSLVLGPKIGQQVAISRKRRVTAARAGVTSRPAKSGPAPAQPKGPQVVGPAPGAVTEIFSVEDNIPR